MRRHAISFTHAFEGVVWALRSQPNYRIHLSLSMLSIVAGWYFEITKLEWIVIILLITFGLAIETLNSALEKLGDAVDMQYNEHIKRAKDAAAGAMLFFALGSTIVAAIIFIPYF